MYIANETQIARLTGRAAYASGAMHDAKGAEINAAIVAQTSGKLPCYAARVGKQWAIVWVSVGSSARIGRGIAKEWLGRFGVNIDNF